MGGIVVLWCITLCLATYCSFETKALHHFFFSVSWEEEGIEGGGRKEWQRVGGALCILLCWYWERGESVKTMLATWQHQKMLLITEWGNNELQR